jgi:hypothetical protein
LQPNLCLCVYDRVGWGGRKGAVPEGRKRPASMTDYGWHQTSELEVGE